MTAQSPIERARGVLRHVTGVWVWHVGSHVLCTDEGFAWLTGLDPAETRMGVQAGAFFSGIHPEDRPRIRIAVAAMMRGAETFNKEFRVVGRDGVVRWVSGRGHIERDSAPEIARFAGALVDITEQKRIEDRLRVAQTAGGVGTFEHMDGFGTATVSEQFCRLLGLHPAASLPVRTINSVVEDGDEAIIQLHAASEERRGGYGEMRIRRADTGEERWLARRGEHRGDGIGRSGRFLGVIYDVTEAKRTEATLRDLAGTLEARVAQRTKERDRIWNRARDLFAVIAHDGRHVALNPAWTEVLGYSVQALLGTSHADLLHPEDRDALAAAYQRLRAGVPLQGLDARLRAADGGYRWIDWTLVREEDSFYAMGRDVTERKELEDQLRQSHKMEALGQLTGGIAHDFNNMLTGISGGLAMARRRMEAGRQEDAFRYMDAAITAAERAAALTHRLLAFARRQPLDLQPVDVGALVASMEDLLRRTLGETIEIAVRLEPALWQARADMSQLESALLNLAINARDAMPGGGRLEIEARNVTLGRPMRQGRDELPSGDYLVIGVTDTGEGMPESIRSKVFEPFFTTKPIGQGTGLGLSMVYGFVRQAGGLVTIDSSPGIGTRVTLYLPRMAEQREQSAAAPMDCSLAGRGQTVLIVEDDPQVRLLLGSMVEDLGYAHVSANDGASALRMVEERPGIDLLLTDVGLPGLNGRQVAEMIRERMPGMPVLFVTAYVPRSAARTDFLAEGMAMIPKPFSLDQLARALAAMLPAGQGSVGMRA